MNQDTDRNASLIPMATPLIQYKSAYVAFVDVLGFREIVRASGTEKVSIYYETVKDALGGLRQHLFDDPTSIDTQIMSDSIVFAVTPTLQTRESKIESLRALCASISHLQFYLALQGIWTRGGIAFGDIAFPDASFVVGPALVTAVELEKIAKYPRVIIEPRILADLSLNKKEFISALRGHLEGKQKEVTWVFDPDLAPEGLSETLQDFVFLSPGVHFSPDFKYADEAAQKISDHLKAGLYGSPLHLEKFNWLRNYFLAIPLRSSSRELFLKT